MTTFTVLNIRDDLAGKDGEPPAVGGYRVLVDRLWPRGISKVRAALDAHPKEVAPSTELRKWFGHDPAKFDAFVERYRQELEASGAARDLLDELADQDDVDLLYDAKDREHNNAVVLKAVLDELAADRG
ncbi:DUF488 domain-containing protein [Acidipropionibacterium jensenii]|uniref:DUF488 domain-containing protein n=1 Tax=Acidipropionibacterium jensenii TaxID=1749 RepID=A0A3Q9UKK1_9ACTN|nr:DUF488 family protein [Acidipropionibacterium jensenii]AZZ40065.1 DUF488 domain-containing protein [Acidipropionibacterium jensenii]QCV87265.1 DUF488 family protein [Acidipropionibacterium jensenii]